MGRVLIVDDNEDNLLLFQEYLEDNGYNTVLASSGKRALELLGEESVDVVVLDVQMPDMDGFEVCEAIKRGEKTRDIPVIFVTAKFQDVDHVAKGLYLGANDYLYKPVGEKELVSRVATMVRLKAAEDEQRRSAVDIDETTGLVGRRFLRQRLDEQLARFKRAQMPLTIVSVDVDGLDKVNAAHGRDIGDMVLRAVGKTLEGSLRQNDLVGRWGADDFLAILPNSDATGAKIGTERLRDAVSKTDLSEIKDGLTVTACFGYAVFDGTDPDVEAQTLLTWADTALAAAKEAGSDQIVAYHQTDDES